MSCINIALRDFVFVSGLILCVIGIACLIAAMRRERMARLGDRALQVLGGPEPHTMETAYTELHRIEQDDRDTDQMIERGFTELERRGGV